VLLVIITKVIHKLIVEQFVQDLNVINFMFDQFKLEKLMHIQELNEFEFIYDLYFITYFNYLEPILKNIYSWTNVYFYE